VVLSACLDLRYQGAERTVWLLSDNLGQPRYCRHAVQEELVVAWRRSALAGVDVGDFLEAQDGVLSSVSSGLAESLIDTDLCYRVVRKTIMPDTFSVLFSQRRRWDMTDGHRRQDTSDVYGQQDKSNGYTVIFIFISPVSKSRHNGRIFIR
jgi:hypothetical protein